jgi:hypothetical protein
MAGSLSGRDLEIAVDATWGPFVGQGAGFSGTFGSFLEKADDDSVFVSFDQADLSELSDLYAKLESLHRSGGALIPGRENVRWVALDLSDSYRAFARDFFPHAQLVADKFHVLRLITPAIHRYIKQLELGRDALPLYKLLRRNPCKLNPELRWRVRCWLADKPELRELWAIKEALNRIYRIHGHRRANVALTRRHGTLAFA